MRGTVIPVIPLNDNSRFSEILASESEILSVKRVVAVHDFAEMLNDIAVVSNLMTRVTPEIEAEVVKASRSLLEYDGLGLNFAYLLGDDPV